MFEPVRKEGDLAAKRRTSDPAEDWWVTDRPRDWDPRDHGFEATLNHGTSLMGKNPNQPKMPEGAMTTVPVQDDNAASGIGPTGETRSSTAAPARSLGSLLAQGSQGLKAFEATAPAPATAPRNSTQDAETLKQWEKGQGSGSDKERSTQLSPIREVLTPSLLKPKGHPGREWAVDVIKHKTETMGRTMLQATPWYAEWIKLAGDSNATAKDVNKAIKQTISPWLP
ncbi:MAG: hypothetical protein KUA35_06610 [Pseudodesulfovibrio sp.]|uniref:Uncharacterized protein n=2 Tax=Desulfovibrionaceae TaxID=194924 RepID=E6VWD8_PSEA9|nr:hypothetical protein [Pseudodesulfovibrio aespoeensis]ADU61344.1 hypothetical protein Daes_0319 [Pseudodesulfovibrio aespoeensis Aspo-2]MBU4557531.1 hypothetical protein [Pseudomonadota bacterium]MBV1763409.1 hypothetical protein [Pseudodesulfovibrio sp.]MBV1772082.1 hypothetical protein [Pseudodesulfovibrio sp.]MCG2733404.1 hypothetical protein [Pseudodesulfovibrio aespoeensis]